MLDQMLDLLMFLLVFGPPCLLFDAYVRIYRKLVFVEKRKYLTWHQLKKELVYHVLFLLLCAAPMLLYIYRVERGGAPSGVLSPEMARLVACFVLVGCPYFFLFILRYGIILAFCGAARFRRTPTGGGKMKITAKRSRKVYAVRFYRVGILALVCGAIITACSPAYSSGIRVGVVVLFGGLFLLIFTRLYTLPDKIFTRLYALPDKNDTDKLISAPDKNDTDKWYFAENGQQQGPVDEERFRHLVEEGRIGADTLVWNETLPEWKAYGTLTDREGAVSPPALADGAQMPVATVTGGATASAAPRSGAAPRGQSSGLAVASLVLGILGILGFGLFLGLPAAICGHIALAKIKRSQGTLSGKGLAIAGLAIGYVSVVATLLAAALLLPTLRQARQKAQQAACVSNMRQIALACHMYAQDYGGVFPPDLRATKLYIGDDTVFRCPVAASAGTSNADQAPALGVDYDYFGSGLTVEDIERPAEAVLAAGKPGNHPSVMIVAFMDGHVTSVPWAQGQTVHELALAREWTVQGSAQE